MSMPRTFVALSFILATTACGQDVVKVSATPGADYNRGAMLVAIDRFVAAGKSAPAFAALAAEVAKLRSGMDDTVAEETERKLLVTVRQRGSNAGGCSGAAGARALNSPSV